jgi:hypothetical protein
MPFVLDALPTPLALQRSMRGCNYKTLLRTATPIGSLRSTQPPVHVARKTAIMDVLDVAL